MPTPARRIGLDQVRAAPERLVAGLMSGTSMDGIDVAVCRVAAGEPRLLELLGARTEPWPPEIAQRLRRAQRADALELARLGRLVGETFAAAAAALAAELGVELDLAGSHGQTIAHEHGVTTMQIGETAFIAERLGCPVVGDFRQNDVAAGGCGAPLVPIVDRWLLARPGRSVLALNIGGIANLSVVPPREQPDAAMIGFDCGPGNMVLDELARRRSQGRESCDRDGRLAAAGHVDGALLAELLAEPALNAVPPPSLGSEQYGSEFVSALLARWPADSDERWQDLLATATQLTVDAIARAYRRHVAPEGGVAAVLVSGGGARNPELMRRLAAALAPIEVTTTATVGLSPDFKEAIAFALLASARIDGIPGNVPAVTGARRAVLLGKVTEI